MNGGVIGRRNVPGVDGTSGVWSLQEVADAQREGLWTFLPADGLLRWYEAESLSLADNDPVTSWTDKSPASDHAVQAVVDNRPTYKTAIVNGRAVVRFDGSNDWLEFAEILDSASATAHIFIVASLSASSIGALLATRVPGSGTQGWALRYGDLTTLQYFHAGFGSIMQQPIADQVNVLELQRDGLNITLGSNGALGTTTTLPGYGASGANKTFICAEDSNGLRPLNGDIAEIVIYDHVLNSGVRSQVLGQLGARYGITIA